MIIVQKVIIAGARANDANIDKRIYHGLYFQ